MKIPSFADGGPCSYNRTFLVIEVDLTNSKISILNVSSIRGKEHKLSFPTNLRIINFQPPFVMPSFIKLDAVYELEYFPGLEKTILCDGDTLSNEELIRISNKYIEYQSTGTKIFFCSADELKRCNPTLTPTRLF